MGSESLDGGREHLDWDRFGVASRDLAQEIADSGFRPDIILAIARGGIIQAPEGAPAASISHSR